VIQISIENDFLSWRRTARKLLQAGVAPHEVLWTDADQNALFEGDLEELTEQKTFKVPSDFLELADTVACIDDARKWALLYRLLFRIVNENRNLLEIESDDDVRQALLFVKAIRRDVHKMHAFVRFRRVEDAGQEIFVAWHEPQHFIVKKAVPFFVRRFGAMRFSILTPKGCAHWNLQQLVFTAGVSSENAPKEDEMERFWKTYYASVFNPARLKVKAMKAEMPMHFWRNLPEAELIPNLIQQSEERTRQMLTNKIRRVEVVKKLSEEEKP
jgi:uracil-DNA glycosylase